MPDVNEKLDPGQDRRADLEAAFSKHEAEEPAPQPETQAVAHEPEQQDTPQPSQPEADDTPLSSESPAAPTDAKKADEAQPEAAHAKRREKGPSAPIDWTPDERQKFKELPEWAQQRIYGREVHVSKVLQETAEARRLAEQFVRTVEPYQTLMQAEGAQHPLQAISSLLQTAATLQLGTPTQKAQRIAQLATHYGVDIELLDKSLAGTLPQNPEQDRLERLVNERMAPVNQLLQQVGYAQQQQVQQVQYQAAQSVADFENNPQYEFFDAVRPVMADMLDLAAQRGEALSLEEAYHRACAYSPQIAQQVAQRNVSGVASQQAQHIQRKQNAASSIVGTRGGTQGAPNLADMSLRDAIAAQMGGGGQRI